MSEAPLYLQGMKKGRGLSHRRKEEVPPLKFPPRTLNSPTVHVQGYTTDKKTHPPRTLP